MTTTVKTLPPPPFASLQVWRGGGGGGAEKIGNTTGGGCDGSSLSSTSTTFYQQQQQQPPKFGSPTSTVPCFELDDGTQMDEYFGISSSGGDKYINDDNIVGRNCGDLGVPTTTGTFDASNISISGGSGDSIPSCSGRISRGGGSGIAVSRRGSSCCPICGFHAIDKRNFYAHLRTSHPTEQQELFPFKCTFCDFSCQRAQNLLRHMKRHTGEKPFECPHCPYRAIQKTQLQSHLLSGKCIGA